VKPHLRGDLITGIRGKRLESASRWSCPGRRERRVGPGAEAVRSASRSIPRSPTRADDGFRARARAGHVSPGRASTTPSSASRQDRAALAPPPSYVLRRPVTMRRLAAPALVPSRSLRAATTSPCPRVTRAISGASPEPPVAFVRAQPRRADRRERAATRDRRARSATWSRRPAATRRSTSAGVDLIDGRSQLGLRRPTTPTTRRSPIVPARLGASGTRPRSRTARSSRRSTRRARSSRSVLRQDDSALCCSASPRSEGAARGHHAARLRPADRGAASSRSSPASSSSR
jgi:hypothetical protein